MSTPSVFTASRQKARVSAWLFGALFVLSLTFALVSEAGAPTAWRWTLIWGVPFSGFLFFGALWTLKSGGSRLTLDERGFQIDEGRSKKRYSWTDVGPFAIRELGKNNRVVGAMYSPGFVEADSARKRMRQSMGYPDLMLFNVYERPLEAICEELNLMRARA